MTECKAALFDLDGVLTDTARLHARAWKKMFDDFLRDYYIIHNKPFTPFGRKNDYLKYVDGKPRLEGALSFLESRNIEIPIGSPDDPEGKETVWGLTKKKNKYYQRYIQVKKPRVYSSTVAFVKRLKESGFKVGVISSSKNCRLILKSCGLLELFETVVDGNTLEEKSLNGKPEPDIFIYAAKNLGIMPSECVVFEDAFSGVRAAIKANFGMVVGINRRRSSNLAEADKVVKDLKEMSITLIKEWFSRGIDKDSWKLRYCFYEPEQEKLREVLCTIGNGYLGTRGCHESQRESPYHYPGFYMAGIFNELITDIKGKKAHNNDMVNLPNWLLVKLRIGQSDFIDPFEAEIIDYRKSLNARNGTLYHKLIFRDNKGRITRLESQRLASMSNPHICAIRLKVKPLNYSAELTLFSVIDGKVRNFNVARYHGLKSHHLNLVSRKELDNGFLMHVKTTNSGYDVALAGRNKLFNSNKKIEFARRPYKEDSKIGEELVFRAEKGKSYELEKTVAVYSSNDSETPLKDAAELLEKTPDYKQVLRKHSYAWKRLWKKAGLKLEGDRFAQRILKLHAYHLFVSYSEHCKMLDVGIPARGLHGEAYHGHIFWDELYTMPFYIHHAPAVAKAALLYRYRRLGAAQEYARENGYKGAMYPWQSADTGREETQTIHYNPRDGNWGPDLSRNQRHVSIAIFYNFYKYIMHAEDYQFLYDCGAEAMVEIARFWASIAKKDTKTGKYHIRGVMGPDEFHEKYPDKKRAGLDDNAYTNVMTAWLMEKTLEIVGRLPDELCKKINIRPAEKARWGEMSRKMNVVVKQGIIMQFDRYDKLKELDWEHYRNKYGNIERMDRILKAEGKDPDAYKLLKQADTLMIFYLLHMDEAISILRRLGCKINKPESFIRMNYDYYHSRTTHGSSLSRFVHNAIATKLKKNEQMIWYWFRQALKTDIYDSQGGTTSEGVHCGLMAGTLSIVRREFAGIKTHSNGITIKSRFPSHWHKLEMRVTHQGAWYSMAYTPGELCIVLESGKKECVVDYKGRDYELVRHEPAKIRL